MKNHLLTNKTFLLGVIIIILGFMILFLIFGFKFFKETINDYEQGIIRIAINKTDSFANNLEIITEDYARRIEQENKDINKIIQDISLKNENINNIILLDSNGNITHSLKDTSDIQKNYSNKKLKETFIFTNATNNNYNYINVLSVATPVTYKENQNGYLIAKYDINHFKNQVIEEFMGDNYKVAIFDDKLQPVVWPFSQEGLNTFTEKREQFISNDIQYMVKKARIKDTSLKLYFFYQQHHLDTYRILTIIFLMGGLYFCVYQFLVEFWNSYSARSYFENIDFEIFNHLREGIIITNRFNRIIFANKSTHDFFPEKNIVPKESTLKELLGQIGEKNQKYTLKKYDRTLEVIRSPLVKNGKFLGSLVVFDEHTESERIYKNLFTKTTELLSEGILFLDRNDELNHANMMANYYLGKLEKGMHISEINTELARSIQENKKDVSLKRVELSLQNIYCELLPIYNENNSYAGTLVFIKHAQDYQE